MSGYNISGEIEELSVNLILAGWWRVFHQSTDFLIIGKLTAPTKVRIETAWSADFFSLKDEYKLIMAI